MNCQRCGQPTERHGANGACPEMPIAAVAVAAKPTVRFRTKPEFEAYYARRYPWLSKSILPHAAWQFALDILYTTDPMT